METQNQMNRAARTAARTVCVGQAWTGLLVFYAVAWMLNAAALHRNNEHLPFGPVRTFWVTVSEPAARMSTALGLDRIREGLARTAGAAVNQ
ncbi:MAG: hypothetical protein GX548_08945 [Lentisphaerae bacterium]|nr:hypothetical protein [Lentisphaerota bacterium]